MTTEIERTKTMHDKNPPNPMEVIQGIAVMQAVTLGFLVGSQLLINRRLRKLKVDPVIVNNFTSPLPTSAVSMDPVT